MHNLTKAKISTIAAIGGLILTAIQATRDNEKARLRLYDKSLEFGRPLTKSERLIASTPSYIPTYISGAATILAILSASHFHMKHEAALTSAIALTDRIFSEYKTAIDQTTDDLAQKMILAKKPRPATRDPEKQCWYIEYHDAIFEATEADIFRAQLAINKEFTSTGMATLNRFLSELGLPQTEYGDILGWDYETNLESWIDVDLTYFEVDNMEVMAIQLLPKPWVDNTHFPTDE